MMFVNSLKLFGSNWVKTLKLFLYHLIIWGFCFAIFLPCFFEFKDLFVENFSTANYFGVFGNSLSLSSAILNFFVCCYLAFQANLGLAIYALIVIFVILPFLSNLGNFAFQEMLCSFMTSKNQIGFFSALIKSLKRSVPFALCKVFYNIVFFAVLLSAVYGLSLISNPVFVKYGFALTLLVVLTLMLTLYQLSVLGWAPALIVFDCNVLSAYRKGWKAVRRHFWSILGVTALYFALFFAIALLCGIYGFFVLLPFMNLAICLYDMIVFFTSQGMRFYISGNKILTPKKLEEVDNINKAISIL